jgi:type II secretory pathway component GspD/PulD (secretin)
MRKAFFYLLLIIVFIIQGCSNEYKNEILKEELRTELNSSNNPVLKKSTIEVLEVDAEHFNILQTDIPDKEEIKQVKILGAQLNDVIALITEATDQDIIFQLQSENTANSAQSTNNATSLNTTNAALGTASNTNNLAETYDETQIRESKVYVSASNIGFGRLLKRTIGDKLSIRYDDGTYYIGYTKTTTLKIPSLAGLADKLKETLETLGATNVAHDSITSSVTFSAREKEYMDIMNYLDILRNNLYVIEYDIAIYNVELTDNYSLGINWNIVPTGNNDVGLISKTSSALGSVGATSTTASFGAVFNTIDMSGSLIAEALTQFGKVESIQRPRLLGIAGTDVTLIDGLDEPYIKELKTTTVGDSGAQTSTVSASALSGIRVTLNSNIMDGTVLTDISLEINDIVGYSNFEVNEVSYTQPRVHTKNIKSNMRVQPGVPIVISGLFRNKSDKGYKGIPGIAQTDARLLGGTEYEGSAKTEMVIIVTPRVIKYVMK